MLTNVSIFYNVLSDETKKISMIAWVVMVLYIEHK